MVDNEDVDVPGPVLWGKSSKKSAPPDDAPAYCALVGVLPAGDPGYFQPGEAVGGCEDFLIRKTEPFSVGVAGAWIV